MEKLVLYHADCLDGFGGAYAAWKVFGNDAEYRPVKHGEPAPENVSGKEVFIIDFSYPKETLQNIEQQAGRLVVLDHHISAKEAVENVSEHVFELEKSGAVLAWEFFHPDTKVPRLLEYIQDGDLGRHELPHATEISAFKATFSFSFEAWDKLRAQFEDDETFKTLVEKGSAYAEYADHLIQDITKSATLVSFEGYEVYAVTAPRILRSRVGNVLANMHAPFAIVWYQNGNKIHFSLRGDGSIDLTQIAEKHGGGGHKSAASFRQAYTDPLPFAPVTEQ